MNNNYLELYKKYFIPSYEPVNFVPTHGHGSHLYNGDNVDLIDFAGGVAATALGQTNELLIEALTKQANQLWHVGNIFTNLPQLELAQKLIENTCFDKVFFSNCGTEAVEAALKLAKRYALKTYGDQKCEIVAFNNAFHGRTLLSVSTGGQAKYRNGFEPLPLAIKHAPFNQLNGLEDLITSNTAAVILEPIQAEGGVIPAKLEFLQKIRELCDLHHVALIFDEVQTGMGRTGSLFAYIQYGVEPDIIAVAKALANGFPIGATLAKEPFTSGFEFASHGATFGGNPLSCAVANKTFDIINNKDFLNAVSAKHKLLVDELYKINQKLDLYCDIRGKGLIVGAELHDKYKGNAYKLVHIAIKHRVSVLNASPNVTRFLPALNIPEADIKEGMKRLANALVEFKQLLA
ncbi:MAG: acetylornithine/succinyldiaminopimelate transaminase [Proteobacteria bacterium]|jgi:predicted acetylornithine/succinylornithine family transaminase|nr:acetylornithine/succinyldiaminopimelate transaminase [Pseudomonadota bacterium]